MEAGETVTKKSRMFGDSMRYVAHSGAGSLSLDALMAEADALTAEPVAELDYVA
jgi:hypothetical protein